MSAPLNISDMMTSDDFVELRKKAEKKDKAAMLDLALAYSDGDGVEPNKDAFFVWVKRAAMAGEPEAAYELAYAYRNGVGTQPDQDQFIDWLQKAAQLKSPRALYDLAILYKEGEFFETSEDLFFNLMKKAADQEEPDALLELAFAFRDGVGTGRNLNSYRSRLKKAAELGNSEAMFHLAFEYYSPKDPKKMADFIYWLKKAADEDQPDALYHLAVAYLKGEGTKSSRSNYFKWMKKAAEAKIPAAMYHLAISHFIKTKPDYEKFSWWIKSALRAGYSKAFIASGLDDLRRENGLRIPHRTLVELFNDLNGLYDAAIDIKRAHILKKHKAKNGVAHFTRFEALNSMLPARPSSERTTNRLRLYNFAYMNDPLEGKRLLDESFPEGESLRKFFSEEENTENPLSWEEHESSVYIGSFTLIGDDLNMWRTTYGNDGQGYCIITPWDAYDQGALDEPVIRHDGEVVNVSEGIFEANEFLSLTLYEVRYEDNEVTNTLNKLKSKLDKILDTRRFLKNAKALDRTVRLIVSHILYLYKSKHYQSEQEARLIADYDISFEGLELDSTSKPSRLFVESTGFLFNDGSRIIIGPRVQQHTIAELDLKRRLARHDLLRKTKVLGSGLRGIYR